MMNSQRELNFDELLAFEAAINNKNREQAMASIKAYKARVKSEPSEGRINLGQDIEYQGDERFYGLFSTRLPGSQLTPALLAAKVGWVSMIAYFLPYTVRSIVSVSDTAVVDWVKLYALHRGEQDKTVWHYAIESTDAALSGELIEFLQYTVSDKKFKNALDANGKTALHYAAGLGKAEIVKFLLEYKFPRAEQDKDGNNALHHAAKSGNPECIATLLKHKTISSVIHSIWGKPSYLSDFNNEGKQPIHCVTTVAALKAFLESDPTLLQARTKEGWLLSDCAARAGNEEVFSLAVKLEIERGYRKPNNLSIIITNSGPRTEVYSDATPWLEMTGVQERNHSEFTKLNASVELKPLHCDIPGNH